MIVAFNFVSERNEFTITKITQTNNICNYVIKIQSLDFQGGDGTERVECYFAF